MKLFYIKKNDSGMRTDKFLQKAVPLLPQSLLYKYIRTKRIKRNGKRVGIADRLEEGDTLSLFISDEFFTETRWNNNFQSASLTLDIVYEDENVLLLNKPQGLVVHEDQQQSQDTLVGRMKRYLYEKGEYIPESENSFVPALVNRIDRNTAGIVIAAKNAETLRILNQKIKEREIEKRYLCLVHGFPRKKQATLIGYLWKDEKNNKVIVRDAPFNGAKTILTRYTVLEERGRLSLLEVELLTGRTHQIRAHLAHIGHPLAGDGKYGTNEQNKGLGMRYQALCAYKLRFAFTTDAGILNYLNGEQYEISVNFIKS